MLAWNYKGKIVAVFENSSEESVRAAEGIYNTVVVPADTVVGAYWDGTNWVNDDSFFRSSIVSAISFVQRFSFQERAIIKSLRATDPLVDILWESLFDPRLTEVNVNHPETVAGINYLGMINNPLTNEPVLSQERISQILV
jgi:hypothetical protein